MCYLACHHLLFLFFITIIIALYNSLADYVQKKNLTVQLMGSSHMRYNQDFLLKQLTEKNQTFSGPQNWGFDFSFDAYAIHAQAHIRL
jgi:hypothetical protein